MTTEKKKTVWFWIAVCLVMLAFFCFRAVSPAQAGSVTLKMATAEGGRDSLTGKSLDYWAELIEKSSNGEIKIQVYYQGDLGGQPETFDQFVKGDIDLMLTWPMTSYDKRIGLLFTPYIFLNWEDALAAFRPGGWMNRVMDDLFGELGIKVFGTWPEGFNGIATRGKYATTIEAAKGIKVRTPPVFPWADTLHAMGYQTAEIAWNELGTAMRNGAVDGDSANIIFWDYKYLKDIIEYYVHTEHIFMAGHLAMNKKSWQKLTTQHQKCIADAAVKVMEKQFQDGRATDEDYRQKAMDHGIRYIALKPEEKAAYVKAVREAIWPEMEKVVGEKIMDQVRANASQP